MGFLVIDLNWKFEINLIQTGLDPSRGGYSISSY